MAVAILGGGRQQIPAHNGYLVAGHAFHMHHVTAQFTDAVSLYPMHHVGHHQALRALGRGRTNHPLQTLHAAGHFRMGTKPLRGRIGVNRHGTNLRITHCPRHALACRRVSASNSNQ